jgi:hypothetical protein
MMMQVLRVQGQALSLVMGVRFLLGRHRRRGAAPGRPVWDEAKRLKAYAGLGLAAPDGLKSSHINFGEGTAAAQRAKQKSKERRKRHRKGRQPPPGAGANQPLFGALMSWAPSRGRLALWLRGLRGG